MVAHLRVLACILTPLEPPLLRRNELKIQPRSIENTELGS